MSTSGIQGSLEDIRATVTEESRRKALIEAVDAFEMRATKEE